jgi:hypothetical protein
MKALIFSALFILSSSAFANDIGAALLNNPVVSGAIKGVEKQYEMKCGKVSKIKVKKSMISADVLCFNSEVIDGETYESVMFIDIEGITLDDTIMIQSLNFSFAG